MLHLVKPVSRADFGHVGLVPTFETPVANADLTFYSGEVDIAGTHSTRATGELSIKWMPSPRLAFEGRTIAGSLELGRQHLHLPLKGVPGVGPVVSINGEEFRWTADIGPQVGAGPVTSLLFHVLNLPWFMGRTITSSKGNGAFWSGRMQLDSAGWEVTVDPVKDLSSSESTLRRSLLESSGFAITHVGYARRQSGRSISTTSVDELLDELTYFLTFCRGAWAPACLPVGLVSGRGSGWLSLNIARAHPWRSVLTWFPVLNHDAAENLYSGYTKRWNKPSWLDPVRHLVSFFAEANAHPSTEIGIVLAQSALELLADKLSVTGSSAAAKIRTLLDLASISPRIPYEASSMKYWAPRQRWADGPEAVTWVRNGITHPKPGKTLDRPARLRVETKWLLLSYLEQLLLWLFDYRGSYINRVRLLKGSVAVWDVRPVPWGTRTATSLGL